MSNRISPEHMAEIKAMTRGVLPSQLLGHIAALEAENERLNQLSVDLRACMVEARHKLGLEQDKNDELRAVVEAALLMRSACPMDWTHGDCRDSQCAVVCCALSALDEEVGE
jgi:hypothetical protein